MLGDAQRLTLASLDYKKHSHDTYFRQPHSGGQRIRTAIAGEHFVASELSKRGWVATLTAKNTPGFIVLAARPTGERDVRIDVKTPTSYQYAWWLGSGVDISGRRDFVVLVDLVTDDESPLYWIVPARTTQRLVIKNQIPDQGRREAP